MATGRPYKMSEYYRDKVLEVTTRIRIVIDALTESQLKELVDKLEEIAQSLETTRG